jgi:glycosyl transferase family 8
VKLVYYSLAALGNEACERQWTQSIRSLRRHNPRIPVCLIVWGTPRTETLAEAARQHVRVIDAGAYRRLFMHLPPAWGEVLARNPTLHKILSLRHCAAHGPDQVLYLDCDTFFFGDVERLFELYRGRHFLAREEPGSRRSHYGYDRSYIDEDMLTEVAQSEGVAPIPPYNTGVILMNGGLWDHLRALADYFLLCAWRLMVGLRFASPLGAAVDAAVAPLLDRAVTDEDRRHRLVYPSSNAWIVEEIALWLTLGRVAGLTHDAFERTHVVQNGEALEIGRRSDPLPIVAHYFGGWEQRFFAHLLAL